MSGSNPFDEDPMATPPAADFFSGGSPSCKFETIGTVHRGTILNFEEAQQRDITTGEPKCWPDGNKCMMLVITLQTEERDENIEDDDGTRRLYVNKPGGMFAAIKKAIGKNKFLPGGQLAVKYTANGKPKNKGFSPPKEYMAHYAPPGNGSGGGPPRVAQELRQRQTVAAAGPEGLADSGEVDPDSIPF